MRSFENNREIDRQEMLRDELAKESLLVRKNSMEVLAIFEQHQDEILEA